MICGVAASRFWAAAVCAAIPFTSAQAQTESRAQGAKPFEPATWARSIQEDYPADALRDREEGTVRMQVTVTPAGQVDACDVMVSSGSASLDAAACAGMRQHARYTAALDESGSPIASSVKQAVRYVLPGPPVYRPRLMNCRELWAALARGYPEGSYHDGVARTVKYKLSLSRSQWVNDCEIIVSSGVEALDDYTCKTAKRTARFQSLPRKYSKYSTREYGSWWSFDRSRPDG